MAGSVAMSCSNRLQVARVLHRLDRRWMIVGLSTVDKVGIVSGPEKRAKPVDVFQPNRKVHIGELVRKANVLEAGAGEFRELLQGTCPGDYRAVWAPAVAEQVQIVTGSDDLSGIARVTDREVSVGHGGGAVAFAWAEIGWG